MTVSSGALPAGAPVTPPSAAPVPMPSWRVTRTARRIGLAAFLCFALTGGGRVVGSDEVTMLELARAMLRGGIAVPLGATLDGPDGRHYTKNSAGQAVLALPLVAAADVAAARAPLSPARRGLAARFVVSFFNALVTAALLALFYWLVRSLNVGSGPALATTLMLGFTTPLWVYAKSFMAEPLQALGLLLALGGSLRAAVGDPRGGRWAGIGVLLAVSVKLSMLPLAFACLWPMRGARANAWAVPIALLVAALVGHGIYNLARFGTPFETGYGAQATPAAYSTPLLVGLYGLLLSSGKGIAWFAPALWLAPAGWRPMRRSGRNAGRAAVAVVAVVAITLFLYSRFEHWAGDGSFGPRYLIPLLPLAFLLVAFALEQAGRSRKWIAGALALAGLVVQIGGVAIYYGAQMREAGDYPYRLSLSDPHFMSESHFNPRYSPIAGHWRMLTRNLGEHLAGQMPRLGGDGVADPRTGISAGDQEALLHGLDFWWLYARYAGFPAAPLITAAVALLLLTGWTARRMVRLAAEDSPAP